ncbi:interferon-induced protein with tetratricopeptide repeats 5-like [Sardina pilchardus]|uniref:interferon-induced protein with tetratricopeptide repeats 5-like n=1 Tax=Sardina pilchardus TaxID=27697 RepID=UPI002E0E62B2
MASIQTDLQRQLDSVECHFTWNLSCNVSILHRQQERLEDRSRHGCTWEGHLYNLLGYVVYHIQDSAEEALLHLRQAEVVLKEQEPEGRGPRLLVNQANLAWVHYHLGELPECQSYLEEVTRLQEEFPAPPGCELHPEVYGEKGWTLVKFEHDFQKLAVANFEMALRGETDRKEWHVGLALAKYKVYFNEGNEELRGEIIEQIKIAKTKDPDNLRMLAMYWNALADVGKKTEETGSSDEALTCLRKAEKMIREQGEEEKDCLLLVNQANLAWVHYLRDLLVSRRIESTCDESTEQGHKAPLR